MDLAAGAAGAGVRAQVAIFVPRHGLAREVKEVIERNRAALRDHEGEEGGARAGAGGKRELGQKTRCCATGSRASA